MLLNLILSCFFIFGVCIHLYTLVDAPNTSKKQGDIRNVIGIVFMVPLFINIFFF